MRKALAALAITGALGIGAVAGALLGVPALSGAQTGDPPTTTTAPHAHAPHRLDSMAGPLDAALKSLVDKGTITQAQADAVRNAVQDQLATRPMHVKGIGGGARLDIAAKAIGITPEALRTELQQGKTVADVAKAHNVDPSKVVDAFVAQATTKINEGVKSGKITQAQADKMISALKDRITQMVNASPMHRPMGHRGGPPVGPSSFHT